MIWKQEKKESLVKKRSILAQFQPSVSLPLVLVLPFVVQIFAAVGITGYLSFRNGQKAVSNLATKLQEEVSDRVALHLDNYLNSAVAINQMNADAIKLGLLDLKNYKTAGLYHWKQLQIFENVGYISYALPTGEYVGAGRWLDDGSVTIDELSADTDWETYVYATDSQGNRTEIIDDTPYEPLAESWYTETVKIGKPIWTEVYAWDGVPDILSVPVNYPLYDRQNNLLAVLSVDLLLKGISDFLRNFNISPSAKVFIVERNGLVIASSSSEQPYKIVGKEARRLNIENSTEPLIKATAQYLTASFGSFKRINTQQQIDFEIEGERHFAQVTPWKDQLGLDWLVVVTMPESNFMAQIDANTRITALLCLASLLTASLIGLWTARWITRPIRRLGDASSAIAEGDLDHIVEVKRVHELGVLARSFNQMASQLKASFAQLDATNQQLEKSNQELEIRVVERTQELQIAKESAEKAQYRAEIANQAKSTFLANMSHELRTPLNAILGFSQIMQRDKSTTPKQQKNLGIVHSSGEHLLSLINDVLDLSKIEAGQIALNLQSFDLHHLLDTTEAMLRLKADTKGLQLSFVRDLDLPQYIRTDERKLYQVLINLLNNALKFTQKGSVTLRAGIREEQKKGSQEQILFFEIEDTGAGIAPEELDTLFEAFIQTESGRKSEEGTGLGLTISRKFVQLMGGDITVSSVLGTGTVFRFTITAEAAIAEELQSRQPTKKVIGLAPNQASYRILVVDDRWENRQIVIKMLEPIGFVVREATNGKEALEIWTEWQPHLIWMDMRMPVMNGYEATEYIKSHLQGQATFIIALTASTLEEEKAIVLSSGCDDFVRKPFREQELLNKMAQYLKVEYIYEQQHESEKTSTKLSDNFCLEPSALQVMPSEWLTQLEKSAGELDDELVLELLNQIPDEHTLLAQALQNKVANFDFDDIVNLIQQTIKA